METIAAVGLTALSCDLDRVLSSRGAQGRAAADRRERHPHAGGRQAPRPGADRRRDLRRDQVRSAPLIGRRGGVDADTPETAYFIAHLSGGSRFTASDLATPSVNVAYGSYYLRYLLNHYNGNEMLAVAAYNGGLANVDSWVARANAAGRPLTVAAIPFGETRAYVQRVLDAQHAYRATYPRELGDLQ